MSHPASRMLRVYVVDMIVEFARHRSPTATMLDDNEDVFDSVTWETPTDGGALYNPPTSGPGFRQSTSDSAEEPRPHDPKWEGYLITSVKDPVKELAETKDAYVSYLVSAKVRLSPHTHRVSDESEPSAQSNLPIFSTPNPSSRRRFQDFVFLRNHLKVDFPACVVPPLPDKHRLGTQTVREFERVLTIHRVCDRR